MRLHPQREGFVARIEDLDLAAALERDMRARLRAALARYAVLVLPAQDVKYEDFLRFAAVFGQVGRCGDITNLNEDGSIRAPTSLDARQARGNALWHTDMPVLASPPLAAMLLAREIPPGGGETQFADLAAAWLALPAQRRRELRSLRAVHELATIRKRTGLTDPAEISSQYEPAEHPLVCHDPFSGKLSMLFGAHTTGIKDWPEADSQRLLDELQRHCTQDRFVYTHRWRQHDLLMWNNRRVMHRVLPYDDAGQRRRLWRAEVVGDRRPSRWPRSLRELAATF
jgi:alpha-ketoglutarate-dependent 2,4-dichlorophenoxyacetate dioxygenase